jgi:hypothetical protein
MNQTFPVIASNASRTRNFICHGGHHGKPHSRVQFSLVLRYYDLLHIDLEIRHVRVKSEVI